MKKAIKSTVLALLAFIIIVLVFPAAAFAEESSFEPRLTAPSRSNSYYNRSLNAFSKTGYGMPNCTAYAYGRIYEITGEEPLIGRGNAASWWNINKRNNYYEYGQEPKLGAIACWSNHVAVVEEIDENTVTVSQSHWRGTYFDTCTFTSGERHFGQRFYGYIYASDSVFEEKEEEKTDAAYKIEKPLFETAEQQNANQFACQDLSGGQKAPLMINSRMLAKAIG